MPLVHPFIGRVDLLGADRTLPAQKIARGSGNMFQIGALVQGRYRIQGTLGHGGMGTVFLARHERLDRLVAIKVMQTLTVDPKERQDFVAQFEAEGRILAALDHPNLARVTDFFEEGNHPCLVMEYIEGKTLEEVARLAPKPLSERRVLEWAGQILDALEYLHTRVPAVVVRDLKPQNLILGTDSRVRLIDFGLARILHPGSGTRTVIRGMGTEGFVPLEQYGTAATDQRSDIYALGATLLYLLSGGVTPPGAHLRIAHSQGLLDPRTVNPTVSDHTWWVIQILMSVTPDGRPGSAADVTRLLLGSPTAVATQTVAPRPAMPMAVPLPPGAAPALPAQISPNPAVPISQPPGASPPSPASPVPLAQASVATGEMYPPRAVGLAGLGLSPVVGFALLLYNYRRAGHRDRFQEELIYGVLAFSIFFAMNFLSILFQDELSIPDVGWTIISVVYFGLYFYLRFVRFRPIYEAHERAGGATATGFGGCLPILLAVTVFVAGLAISSIAGAALYWSSHQIHPTPSLTVIWRGGVTRAQAATVADKLAQNGFGTPGNAWEITVSKEAGQFQIWFPLMSTAFERPDLVDAFQALCNTQILPGAELVLCDEQGNVRQTLRPKP
jgi:serine/threonine protein kinase